MGQVMGLKPILAVLVAVLFMLIDGVPPVHSSDAIYQDCAPNEELALLQVQIKTLSRGPPVRSLESDPDTAGGLDSECEQEINDAQQDPAKSGEINNCLSSKGYNDAVQDDLRDGDHRKATSEAAKGFMECGNITEKCAQEEAEGVVLNIMLSGGAVEDACWQELDKIQKDQEKVNSEEFETCQDKAMKSVVEDLNHDDLDGALDIAAKEQLQGCFGISKRCSVQLSPVLINQIVEQAQHAASGGQQPITNPEPIPSDTTVLLSRLQPTSLVRKPLVSLVDAPMGTVDTIIQHWSRAKARLLFHKL